MRMAPKNKLRPPRFFDINHLIRERNNLKDLRNKFKHQEEKKERNLKRFADNMYLIKNKVFHYKFNQALINPEPAEIHEPYVKRRIIQDEGEFETEEYPAFDMEVEPVCPENLLQSDLEVVSPIPPDMILEPSTSQNYLRIADVEDFQFDPSWKPLVPEPVQTSVKNETDEIQLSVASPQNFQASAGHFDKYKTCFKRRGDLRMKDAVDCGEKDASLDHPRIKSGTTLLDLQNRDNLQHWTKLKDQFCPQPLGNDPENDSPDSSLFPLVQCDFNQDSKNSNLNTPGEFFNPQTLRTDQLYEYVQNL